MRAAAGAVGVGLRHEGREAAVLARDLMRHQAEEHEAVGHRERIEIAEVDLELADAVLVVEAVDVPAEAVHGVDELADPAHVVEHARDVIGRLVEVLAVGQWAIAQLGIVAEDEELRLHAEVHREAQVGGLRQHALQDVAAAGLEGLALAPEIAREPGDILVPRQHGRGCRDRDARRPLRRSRPAARHRARRRCKAPNLSSCGPRCATGTTLPFETPCIST